MHIGCAVYGGIQQQLTCVQRLLQSASTCLLSARTTTFCCVEKLLPEMSMCVGFAMQAQQKAAQPCAENAAKRRYCSCCVHRLQQSLLQGRGCCRAEDMQQSYLLGSRQQGQQKQARHTLVCIDRPHNNDALVSIKDPEAAVMYR